MNQNDPSINPQNPDRTEKIYIPNIQFPTSYSIQPPNMLNDSKIKQLDVYQVFPDLLQNQIQNTQVQSNNDKINSNQNEQEEKITTQFTNDDIPKINNSRIDFKPEKDEVKKLPDTEDLNKINNIQESIIKFKNDDIPGAIIHMSQFNIKQKIQKTEEENKPIPIQKKKNQNEFENWSIKSYIPEGKKNNIDNLQELLKYSHKYDQILNSVPEGKHWLDSMFPPRAELVTGFPELPNPFLHYQQDLIFLRPEKFQPLKYLKIIQNPTTNRSPSPVADPKIIPERPKMFNPDINSNSVRQGDLGDCYFMCAISSIAVNPYRLERLFLTKKENPQRVYALALCINGIWEEVILDDYFPCRLSNKIPIFSHSKRNWELWVMLLEKAWAKIHGGYGNIAAGLIREALRDLTGASCITHFVEKQNPLDIWEKVIQAQIKNYIMTAGSDDLGYGGKDTFISKIGLAGSHGYSILGVYQIMNINGILKVSSPSQNQNIVFRLLKIRNPWGKKEWKGDWSDNSSQWTNELRKELGVITKEDGVFFMELNDFSKYFSDVQICHYMDDAKYSSIKFANNPEKHAYFTFEIQKQGDYYFSLNQKNKRFFNQNSGYQYSPNGFVIARMTNEECNFIGCQTKADKENWIYSFCQPGRYFVKILTNWKSIVNECSFSVYGPSTCNLIRTDRNKFPRMFSEKVFLNHARNDKQTQFQPLASQDTKFKVFDNHSGFGYIYFENNSQTMCIEITIELAKSKNIKLCKPFKGLRPSFTILPKDKKIVLYEATGAPYRTQMQIFSAQKQFANLAQMVKQPENLMIKKKFKGNIVDISGYILKHQDGLIIYYANRTKYWLYEKMEFVLKGCYIEGRIGNEVELAVGPGKEEYVNIVRDRTSKSWEAKIKDIRYTVIDNSEQQN